MKGKKENLIAILIVVIGILIVLVITKTSLFKKEKMITVPLDTDTVGINFRENFIVGCTQSGEATYKFCSCAYNRMEQEYGEDGMIDLSLNYLKTEQLPEKIEELVLPCIE